MDFELTEEQRILKKSVHDFVKKECPSDYAAKLDEEGEFPRSSRFCPSGRPTPSERVGLKSLRSLPPKPFSTDFHSKSALLILGGAVLICK